MRRKHRNRNDKWFLEDSVSQKKMFSFKIKCQAKNVFPSDVERTIDFIFAVSNILKCLGGRGVSTLDGGSQDQGFKFCMKHNLAHDFMAVFHYPTSQYGLTRDVKHQVVIILVCDFIHALDKFSY